MSTAINHCVKCNTTNIETAQFCGGCGASLGNFQPSGNTFNQQPSVAKTATSSDWKEKAGLFCGIASIFLCGIITAIPGLYFSWSAFGTAREQGRSTGIATTGLVLNGLGILGTILLTMIVFLLLIWAASSGSQDPMMEYNQMQQYPYGY